jgi:ubiquinone/menaquinone biosynthesis C-methylase UbiE/uncharacterized protein YbaR (Trm112 family)
MKLPTDLLRCPGCEKGPLSPAGRKLACEVCGEDYPVRGGVIDLLPEKQRRTLAQGAMEFHPIVRMYESRVWRRNPMISAVLQLSFEEERDLVLDAAALTGGERVLDLACGTGLYSRAFADRLPRGHVVGLDLSFPMLREANRKASRAKVDNVTWIHGDALKLPFPSSRFDVVNCCGGLHFFPDVPATLRELRRLLKPEGRITVASLRRFEGKLIEWAVAVQRKAIGVSAFTRRELESLLSQAGFGWVQCHHEAGSWVVMSGVRASGRRKAD